MTTLVERGAFAEAVSATRAEGREPKLEKALAEALLESAARSPDAVRRSRAFAELSLAGTRSRPILERLENAREPLTRALACKASMQLGDDGARDTLRGLADSADSELSALGYGALEPDRDRPQLLAVLTQPNRARRLAAVHVLRGAERSTEVRVALESVVQHDPEPDVRAAALTALTKQGPESAAVIDRALDDESESVRVAASSALASIIPECAQSCDRAHLLARLGRDLGSPPTVDSLAAAAAMMRIPSLPEPERAHDVFKRALESSDLRVRAVSAVMCRGLAAPGCDPSVLRVQLRVEKLPQVKLLLALAIGVEDPAAKAAFLELSDGADAAIAVEAAAELAAAGDVAAQQKVVNALQHADAAVRLRALRSIGKLAADGVLPEDSPTGARVVDRLADRDERVRVAAATAILALG
jgi:HEAT repeat protein